MKRQSNENFKLFAKSIVCLLLVIFLNAACGIVKNPLRDYSRKPFNSEEWLKGDAIERGRMILDLFEKSAMNGKPEDAVLKLLGEPDKKLNEGERVVWLYRVDLGENRDRPYFPVTFDRQRGTFTGRVKNGKMSYLTAE